MGPSLDADVAVVGAGPAGAVLALALSRRGSRVVLVDQAAEPRDKPCGEGLMPLGGRILCDLGLDLAGLGYPAVDGVRYRLAGGPSGAGSFVRNGGAPGFGVRRLRFNRDLLEAAARAPGVRLATGCRALDRAERAGAVDLETSQGHLSAGALVCADGLSSRMARRLGWSRPPRPPHRYGLVGHLEAPGHVQREIVVTLLPGREVYAAPAGDGQVLVAVLGPRGCLRLPGRSVADSYRLAVDQAHPELAGAISGTVHGAGPFKRRASRVAEGRTFLLGDAAGFTDPLTGDAMAAAMAAGLELAGLLARDPLAAAPTYRAWYARQWRRRVFVTAVALALTGSGRRAARALRGLSRRPAALDVLLEVNGGDRELRRVGLRDWAALAGL